MAKKRSKNANGRKRRRMPEKHCWWALPVSCLMITILAAAAFMFIHEFGGYRRFRVMRSAVESETYYTGIVVEGYNLAGVNAKTAVDFWETTVEPSYKNRVVSLSYNGKTYTKSASELGYKSNYSEVLNSAWSQGRGGTLEERYRSINNIRSDTKRYDVRRTVFDASLLREWTDSIAKSLSKQPVDATVFSFNTDNKAFAFSESVVGYGVDADALYKKAFELMSNGGGSHYIEVEELQPTVKTSDLKNKFGQITSAVTNASTSNKNRLTNLQLACAAINGYCVQPGETFSFNDVVGQRTKARGYKMATVYQSGEVAEDIGGGVCQVSTTLWNAAMKANCDIVERHEHSRPVAYVDRGKDATVNWKTQDMRFKNTSKFPMYLVCYVSDNKRVYCEIYGELLPEGVYITVDATTTRTVKPDSPIMTYNPLLDAGEQIVLTEPRTGYYAKAYRVYHKADGSELKRDLLCESYYKPARAEIEYGM